MKVHIYKIIKNLYSGNNFFVYANDSTTPVCVCPEKKTIDFKRIMNADCLLHDDIFYVVYKEQENDTGPFDTVLLLNDYPTIDLINNPIGIKRIEGRVGCLKALSLLGIKMDKERVEEKKNEPSDSPFDNILRPMHYTKGRKHEPKDVIRDWGLNFNLGNAVKYISRAGRKDDIISDLEKAMTYIRFELDAIREEIDQNE